MAVSESLHRRHSYPQPRNNFTYGVGGGPTLPATIGGGGTFMGVPVGGAGYSIQRGRDGSYSFSTPGNAQNIRSVLDYVRGMRDIDARTGLGYQQDRTAQRGQDMNYGVAGLQSGAQRYGHDSNLLAALGNQQTQRHGIDTNLRSQQYTSRNQLIGEALRSLMGLRQSQLANDASRYGSTANLLGTQYGADADTEQARIGAGAQLGVADRQNIPALANLGFKERVFDQLTAPLVGQLMGSLGGQLGGGAQGVPQMASGGQNSGLINTILEQVVSPEETQRRLQEQYGRNRAIEALASRQAGETMTGAGFSSRSPVLAAIRSQLPFQTARLDVEAANRIPQADRRNNIAALTQAVGADDRDQDRLIALMNAQTGQRGVGNQLINSILNFAGALT